MASRMFSNFQTLGARRVMLNGSFQPNGASAPLNPKGNGWSVAHTAGSNLYTVTFQDAYFDYDAITLDIQGPTVLTLQLAQEPDVKVAQQIVMAVYTAGGSASNDLAFNANQRVHFQAILKNTSGNF